MSHKKIAVIFLVLLMPTFSCNRVQPKSGAVEAYVVMAAKDCDEFNIINATVFSPDDPRLKCKPKKRLAKSMAEEFGPVEAMSSKLNAIRNLNDACLGPVPTAETDQIEARMLMDKDLVGTGSLMEGQLSCQDKLLVFLTPSSLTMSQARRKYGEPGKSVGSGNGQLHFYGRMILAEAADDKIHAVLRRAIMGTK